MRFGVRGLVAGALTLATLAWAAGVAQAQGRRCVERRQDQAPVYDYTTGGPRAGVHPAAAASTRTATAAIDRITIDIVRPKESGPTNKVPAIIDPSPYYTSVGRGNEGQCMTDWNADGDANDRLPLFYDNYFVPRGYAFIAAHWQRHRVTPTTAACTTAARPTSPASSPSSTGSTAASRPTSSASRHAPPESSADLAQRLSRP